MRLLSLCGILAFALPVLAADAPVPAKQAATKMTLPQGFQVKLFAGEPDVVQPIAFTFDDRGRMWVVECLMYPKWSQDGTGGKDRVIILEDTDGDGTFDKKTVFLENGVNLSGIELGFGGVYLCSSPNLIFIPIKNDKPAAEPQVLLDGWNIKDAKHNVFNGLVWGPDGWLYGCNGIQTKSYVGTPGTPKEKRPFFDCGVWRFHPTKKVFEVVANGTTNPWGLDFDETGEMFITNCVIDHLFHVLPGGHYQRMYGTDPNANVYGHMTSCVDYRHWGSGAWTDSRQNKDGMLKKDHDDAGGGHAHSGAAIYLGDQFPAEYRNTLFTCNIHGSRLNNDGLQSSPAGPKGVRRPDFLFANDPWFRGICVKQGPAGELFVSDWCDTGECHNYNVADISNGRIYRVTYGDSKPWRGDVAKMTLDELVQAQLSTNEWLVRRARLQLQMRAFASAPAKEQVTAVLMKLTWEQDKPIARNYRRKVWALQAVGGIDRFSYVELAKDDHSGPWLLRYGVEAGSGDAHFELEKRLKSASSTFERLQLASIFSRLPQEFKEERIALLCSKPTEDRNLAWMSWFAIEPVISARPRKAAFEPLENYAIPLVRQNMVRTFFTSTDKNAIDAYPLMMKVLELSKNDVRRDILLGMQMAYSDRTSAKAPEGWERLNFQFGFPADIRDLAEELSIKFGDQKTMTAMKERILQKGATADARQSAIRLLAAGKANDLAPVLLEALQDEVVRGAAIRALAAYPDAKTPGALLALYPKLTVTEKSDAIQTLVSRATSALALLEAVEHGSVPKPDITAYTARQIAALKDKAVIAKLEKVWGVVKPASAARVELMAKYKQLLAPEKLKAANLANGKLLFAKNCATCHKLHGEGQAVGPDLTGSQRSNLDYVLENVVDPSANVANEYKVTHFALADGRVVSGVVRRETAATVIVRTLNEEVAVTKKDIDERKSTALSLMPDGLFDAMKPEDVLDLVAYLQSK